MDALVKIFDEFRSHVRSPIWGTIGLYVILLNWKAFYYLLFADVSVPEKFSFWDENVSHKWLIYYPLALGVVSVVTVPWIRLGFTWVNMSADLKLHNIQSTHRNEKKIHDRAEEDKLEEAIENQKIERTKRLKEAEKVGDEDLVKELRLNREVDEQTGYPKFTEIEKWIVHILCVMNLKGMQLGDVNRADISSMGGDQLYVLDRNRNFLVVAHNRLTPKQDLELKAGLQKLEELGLLNKAASEFWEVTLPLIHLWENYVSGEEIEHPVWFREKGSRLTSSTEI